jgi:hypothetical protein
MRNKKKREDRLKEINNFVDLVKSKVGHVIVVPPCSGEDGNTQKIASLLVEVFDTYTEFDVNILIAGLKILQNGKLHKVYFKYSEIEFL